MKKSMDVFLSFKKNINKINHHEDSGKKFNFYYWYA